MELKLSKFLVIGDIHGEYSLLINLIEKVKKQYPNITTILTGDLVDRGPDSSKVLEYVYKENKKGLLYSVKGNHDDIFLEALTDIYALNMHVQPSMGGKSTLFSFLEKNKDNPYSKEDINRILINGISFSNYRKLFLDYAKSISSEYKNFLYNLPYYLIIKDFNNDSHFLITHAGISKLYKDSYYNLEQSINSRLDDLINDILWNHKSELNIAELPVIQIIGHKPILDGPSIHKHVIYMDTGAAFSGGKLSGLVMDTKSRSVLDLYQT